MECAWKIRGRIFFFVGRTCHCRVMSLFRPFFSIYLVNRWDLVNKISGETLELVAWYLAHRLCPVNFWQNAVNIWLNYLPFPTLAFYIVKESCQQNIWRTAWARIMIPGVLFGHTMQMTWSTFHRILWIFDWIMPLFRLGHFLCIRAIVNKISGEPLEVGSWY